MATNTAKVKLTLKITSFVLRLLMNIIFYILVVILIVNVSKMAFEFTYELYGPVTVDKEPGTEIIFQIKKGESTMDIASKLEINRAISNKYSFYLKTKLQNLSIMPGTYKISTAMTYDEILDIITDYSASIIQDDAENDSGTDTDSQKETGTGTDNTTADKATDSDADDAAGE
jgi:UPF0755 protein